MDFKWIWKTVFYIKLFYIKRSRTVWFLIQWPFKMLNMRSDSAWCITLHWHQQWHDFMVYFPHSDFEFCKQETCMNCSAFGTVFHWVSLQSRQMDHLFFPHYCPWLYQENIYIYRLKQVHRKVSYIYRKYIYLKFLKFSV